MARIPLKLFALIIFIVALPLLILIGLLIKVSYPGSIFFKQRREGKNGVPFYIWKLRTMTKDADKSIEEIIKSDEKLAKEWQDFGCLRNDKRIAGVIGRLCRKTSIDELPQLINVFKGEMAFVGPRPLEIHLAETLNESSRSIRNSVLPGVTGLWQVGPRSSIMVNQMRHYDYLYIRRRSTLTDFCILLKTVKVVLYQTGD